MIQDVFTTRYVTKRIGFGDKMFPEADMSMCWNVYTMADGLIRPLPFNGGRAGLWFFDGQVFYLRGEHGQHKN